jgi:hypothetical protein
VLFATSNVDGVAASCLTAKKVCGSHPRPSPDKMASGSMGDYDANSPATESDELDSLPSISSGVLSSETASESDAQREWETSLEQISLLLTMVIVPFAGKYFGRKFAYWSRSTSAES